MKTALPHIIQATCFMFVMVFFSGCETTTHTFKVDAINNPEVKGGESFAIVSGDYEIDESDPQFKKVSEYVKTVLTSRGYYEAPSIEDADMIIEVEYGTGEGRPDYETRASADGMTGRHASDPMVGRIGRPVRIITEDREVVEVLVYEKYLKITAVDNRQAEEGDFTQPRAWQVTVKNTDENQDIEEYLAPMTAAAIPYVGEKTEGQEKITVRSNSPEVEFVKSGK